MDCVHRLNPLVINSSHTNHSPIHRLPIEILGYIFNLACSADHVDDADPLAGLPFDPDLMITPLKLSTVSRHWRMVALSVSSLWSKLCITAGDVVMDDMEESSSRDSMLDLGHISSYLRLSRHSPLDILVDVRDPDWNFVEDEDTSMLDQYDDGCPYKHPFTAAHMDAAMDVLLPHLARWRSLTVLTDTYAPMHAALVRLSTASVPHVASLPLTSLVLMRCNEYVAHSPIFTPQLLSDPNLLPFAKMLPGDDNKSSISHTVDLLPNLRNVVLSGVHVDWPELPRLLPSPSVHNLGLTSLQLSHHSEAVRPRLSQFLDIVKQCPNLTKLNLSVSGPILNNEDRLYVDSYHGSKIPLVALEDLTLAYTDALDGCRILNLLHLPNVKSLTLEDGVHPADPVIEDGGRLLEYCSTGHLDLSPGWQYGVLNLPLLYGTNKPRVAGPSDATLFPLLESVTFVGVCTSSEAFKAFFRSHPTLQHLTCMRMSTYPLVALLPSGPITPCPNLRTLCIRGAPGALRVATDNLASARSWAGVPSLREVRIHTKAGGAREAGQPEVVRMVHGARVEVWAGEQEEEEEEAPPVAVGSPGPFALPVDPWSTSAPPMAAESLEGFPLSVSEAYSEPISDLVSQRLWRL